MNIYQTTSNNTDNNTCMNLQTTAIENNMNITISDDITMERIEKSRERNREHAKKTRLRKKVFLENLKIRVTELKKENEQLELVLEENNTANILLGLSSNSPCKDLDSSSFLDIANGILGPAAFQNKDPLLNTNSKINTNNPSKTSIIDQLRSVVRAEAMIFLKPKFDSSFSNLNKLKQSNSEQFETSDDIEENDFDGDLDEDSESSLFKDGKSRARSISNLSEEGVDTVVRKERNRMHAKLTRDRKKMFTSRLQLLIQNLEYQNQVLRQRLRQNAVAGGSATSSNVTDSGDASSNYSLASANRSSIDNSGFSDQRSTSSNDSLNLDFQQKNNDSEKSDQTNVLSLSSFQSKRKYSSENKN